MKHILLENGSVVMFLQGLPYSLKILNKLSQRLEHNLPF